MRELEHYMSIEADLLPCPFCGEKAVLTNVRSSDKSFCVSCVNESCFRPVTPYYDSKAGAVDAWNQRVAREEPSAMPRKLRNAVELVSAIGSLGFDLQYHDDTQIAAAVALLRTVNPEMFDWLSQVLAKPVSVDAVDRTDGIVAGCPRA